MLSHSIGTLEPARLALQAELDRGKTQAERNRLGQFPTPAPLAKDILKYARALLPPAVSIRFMDPAFGTGPFYSALLETFPTAVIAKAWGYEIDPYYAEKTIALWQGTPLELRLADFTTIAPPESEEEKPNLLVCNPPYVRHHHLENGEKIRLQKKVLEVTGVKLSGLAGFYCYYMTLSHAWLADGGLAAWLIPSEFMDVNYGREVKEYLLNRVTLLRIHRFDPLEIQFDDALVSSSVVWFRNTPPAARSQVQFTYGGTLEKPKSDGLVSTEVLRASPKWTRFPPGDEGIVTPIKQEGFRLSDLFIIRRGLATGSNEYFIMTKDQAQQHRIPQKFLVPILPSSRLLHVDEVEADADGNPMIDKQLFLLSCDLPEDDVKQGYPSLWWYYQSGIDLKINEQYLCRHRDPWYSQEKRSVAPFLCTYMGRSNTRSGKPFRFILNHSKAIAANAYLMLYPKPLVAEALRGRPERARAVWRALNEIESEELTGQGRVYGGGLRKMEPKELGNVPASRILSVLLGFEDEQSVQMSLFDQAEPYQRI